MLIIRSKPVVSMSSTDLGVLPAHVYANLSVHLDCVLSHYRTGIRSRRLGLVAHLLGYGLGHLAAAGVAHAHKQQSHGNAVLSGFNELNRIIRNMQTE